MSPPVCNYDVFISYKREEESWASRLADTLRTLGLRVWRDQDANQGIRVGEKWSDSIRKGVRNSSKMVVLWSQHLAGNANSIVHQELNEMKSVIDTDKTNTRRFVPISLDGTSIAGNPTLAQFQADLSFAHLYAREGAGGADRVAGIEWYAAIRGLIETLGITDVTELRVVVATMTRGQAEQLKEHPEQYAVSPQAYECVRNLMSLTVEFDTTRYGNSPDAWRPYPQLANEWSIQRIIDAYDQEKRHWLSARGECAKWIVVSYSEQIAADDLATRQAARDAIADGPCLVVVDPVSLLHKTVYKRIITDSGLPNHPEAFIIGIAPCISQLHAALYDHITKAESELELLLEAAYSSFRKPYESDARLCVLGVDHEFQFARWIQVAADRIVSARRSPMRGGGIHPSHRRRLHDMVRKPPTELILCMTQKEAGP